MQPSGELHIGNWLGALRQWVELARAGTHETLFCVVDAHAITVDYTPEQMRARVFETAVAYLAGGLDPERSQIFVQSDVRQHTELAWYLSSCTQMGELQRMTQFKDKAEQHKHNINAALFTYPVLMAADVLAYKATLVPVGDDQVQHLELARDIARRFNQRFGEVFPEPAPRLSKAPRIMGLDGAAKMSKTKGNTIALGDAPDVVWNKLKRAFTDPQRLRRSDPGRPEVCNIFAMHRVLTPPEVVEGIDRDCRTAAIGCGDCKKLLNDNMMAELGPIQEKTAYWNARPDEVRAILREGAERCRVTAEATLTEVREAMGLGSGA